MPAILPEWRLMIDWQGRSQALDSYQRRRNGPLLCLNAGRQMQSKPFDVNSCICDSATRAQENSQWFAFNHRTVTACDCRDSHGVILERLTHFVEKRARIGQGLFFERILDGVPVDLLIRMATIVLASFSRSSAQASRSSWGRQHAILHQYSP
jgi:hypothetical protein